MPHARSGSALLTPRSLIAPRSASSTTCTRGDIDMAVVSHRLDRAVRPRRRPHGRAGAPAGADRSSASACSRGAGAALVAATSTRGDRRGRRRSAPRARRAGQRRAAVPRRRGADRRVARAGGRAARLADELADRRVAPRCSAAKDEAVALLLPGRCARSGCRATQRRRASRIGLAPRARLRGAAGRRRADAGTPSRAALLRRSPPRSRSRSSSAVLTEEVHRRRGEARFGSLVRHAQRPDHGRSAPTARSPTRARRSSASSATTPDELIGTRFDALRRARRPRRACCRCSPTDAHAAERARRSSARSRHRDGTVAPVRDPVHEPARRRARRRHRPQRPRRQRAQGVRGSSSPTRRSTTR